MSPVVRVNAGTRKIPGLTRLRDSYGEAWIMDRYEPVIHLQGSSYSIRWDSPAAAAAGPFHMMKNRKLGF